MPVEVKCEHCGQTRIEPDPPENVRTQEEKVAFRKAWDAEYERRNGG